MVTVIEGENLTNDWTALVLYRVAVAAVVTGTFSLLDASVEFVLSGVGGLAIGLVAGRIIREIRRRIDDPPTEITISILSGYAAYLPAEELGFSGVIAAVTVGIYMGWHTPELTTPLMRTAGRVRLGDPHVPAERGPVPARRACRCRRSSTTSAARARASSCCGRSSSASP